MARRLIGHFVDPMFCACIIADVKPLLYLCALLCSCTMALGDIIYIESRTPAGGVNIGDNYQEVSGTWTSSTSPTTVSGATTNIGTRFSVTPGASFSVSPFLRRGAQYRVEIASALASVSTNIIVGVSVTGGGGLPATTTAFQYAQSSGKWAVVGTLTVNSDVDQPTITFAQVGGTVTNSASQRFYAGIVEFSNLCGCFDGPTISSSISSNQMTLSWVGTFAALQACTNLSEGFVDLTGPIRNAPYKVNIDTSAPMKLFRIRH